jgi:RNA polymerase sigma factor (sigma-70 family)
VARHRLTYQPTDDPADGFEALYRDHWHRLKCYLHTRSPGWHLIEEVVQETFLAALANWSVIRRYEKPSGWLYKTADFKLKERLRHEGRCEPRAEIPAELVDPYVTADASVAAAGLLAKLPPRIAQVVYLSCSLDFSSKEVAQILGITLNTVQTYRRDGRRRFRDIVQQADLPKRGA